MKTRISFLNGWPLLLLVGALCLGGCASDHSPKVKDIATNFTNYHQITAQEVFVNPELARLCVGASVGQVEKAREKHGPHANTAITIYMNDPAAKAFPARNQPYPVDSVIVKHKSFVPYFDSSGNDMTKATDNGVGGMIKRPPGYDPANGDWEYFYFEDPVALYFLKKPAKNESGRIATCVKCHAYAQRTDYVFGTWQQEGNSRVGPPQRGE